MAALLLISALAAVTVISSAAPLTWARLDDPTAPGASERPSPRRGAGLVFDAARDRLVLWGGTGDKHYNDAWEFNLTARTWRELVQPPGAELPEARHSFLYGIHTSGSAMGVTVAPPPAAPRRELIIASGQSARDVLYDVWAMDLDTHAWRRLPDAGDVPDKRYGAAGGIAPPSVADGASGSRLWMSHGFSNEVRFSDTRYYDLHARRWVLTHGSINSYNPTAPHARCIVSSAVTTAEQLVMYGGCLQNGGTGGPCPARDTWLYDTSRNSWRRLSEYPSPRTRGAMLPLASGGDAIDGLGGTGARFILLYGGFERDKQTISVTEAPDDQLPVLDLDSGKWRMLRAAGQVPPFRGQPAAAADVCGGRVFVFGGLLRSSGAFTSDLYVLQGDPQDTPGGAGGYASSFLYPHLHGIFMGLSWGLLLQAGWFIARYFKAHDPTWFNLHRGCQVSGLLLSVVGLAVVLAGGVKGKNLSFSHGVIGLITMGLGLLQPINAFFRPHKGERFRWQWEWLHLTSGRVAVVMGAANVSLGTFLIQGPDAVWISWHVLLAVFVVAVLAMEVRHQRALWRTRGQAVKTFQGASGQDLREPATREP